VAVDADCLAVLDAADWAWSLSDGRLDATILPLIRFWHDADRTRWPSQAEIAAARALVDWTAVQRRSGSIGLAHPGMALDLGGVGKEWAVDQLIDRAAVSGIDHCLVELGGDCRARGRQGHVPGWWVTLPGANTALLLGNEAIATSGIGTRYRLVDGRLVPHLIDARSGQPACGAIRFASIVAPNCLLAGIRSSDICLLAQADPQCIHERAGALPAWCGGSDDRIYADQRLLARMHTIGPSRMSA
jgi:thiamine biosynthesis lipoprotein